jgi:hypothetical protein
MIYLMAFGLLAWLLMEEGSLFIYHSTMWRDGYCSDGRTKWKWNPTHGPQTWPWWRLISIRIIRMRGQCADPGKRKVGLRFWFYTRWVDQHIDILVPARDVRRS